MALNGFSIGNTSATKAPATPSTQPSKATGGALGGFSIGQDAAPKLSVPLTKVPTPFLVPKPETPKQLQSITKLADVVPKPSVSLKTQNSTPSVNIKPITTNEYTDLPNKPIGDTISAPTGNTHGENIISKIGNSIINFFGESNDRRMANQAVQKTIVDQSLVDIGKQIGIDKQFPINTKQDAITAKYYQDKQIADYVRSNYDSIKGSLNDPTVLPDHPEMLGPKYAEVQKNLDAYTKQMGVRTTPTNKEYMGYVLAAPIAGELGISGAIGFAGAMAFSYVEHAILGDTIAGKVADKLGITNSNVRDVMDLAEMFGIGGALHTVYKNSPEITKQFTKNVVTEYMPGQKIRFEPEKVFDILSGKNKLTTAEERSLFNNLGLDAKQMLQARKDGIPVDIPGENIVNLVDKPYWSKIKSLFRVSSNPQEISRTSAKPSVGAETRQNRLLGEGVKTSERYAAEFQKDVKKSIAENGEDVTHQLIVDQVGVDSPTATRIINEAKSVKTPQEVKQLSQKLVPKTEAMKGIKVNDSISDKEVADGLKKWFNQPEDPTTGQVSKISTPVMNRMISEKIGVDELPFNEKGEITLYRDKAPKSGQIESYSVRQRLNQEPYTIHRDQIIASTESKAMQKIFDNAYQGDDIQNVTNRELLGKYNKLESEVFVRNNFESAKSETGLSKSVKEKALESKLNAVFEGNSEYSTVNIKDQADKSNKLIENDYEQAKRIAFGHENAPGDLKNISVFTAVEARAIKDGDTETLIRLSQSSVGTELSESAQNLRLSQERYPDSPVAAIREVSKAREKAASRKAASKKKVVGDIKKSIKKATPTKQNWSDFVDSITC